MLIAADGTDYGVYSPIPVHGYDSAGGAYRNDVLSRAMPHTCIPRKVDRASTPACRMR